MLSLKPTQDVKRISKIMLTRPLPDVSLSDEELQMLEAGTWHPDMLAEYYIVQKDEKDCAVVKVDHFTNQAACCHFFLLPKFWGTGESLTIVNYVVDELKATKIVTMVPQPCEHVMKLAVKAGFEIEGVLKDAVVWRNILTNLIIMGKTKNG